MISIIFTIIFQSYSHLLFNSGGESNLLAFHGISMSDRELALVLIQAMIASQPGNRPPATAVQQHPIFWNAAQILGFFQV